MIKINKIPKFKSIEEERRFWDTNELTDFPELKEVRNVKFPRPKHIVLSLKPQQFKAINRLAIQKRISCQRLLQKWIDQKISEEKTILHH